MFTWRSLPALVVLSVSCGTQSPSSPSAGGPSTPSLRPGQPEIVLRVDEAIATIVRLGDRPVVTYQACGRIQNVGPAIRYRLELEPAWEGGSSRPTAAPAVEEYSMEPSGSHVGCGLVRAYDHSFAHQVATRYRMRVRFELASGGPTRVVEGEGPVEPKFEALPPRIIVSEFRSRGPNGPGDQFIELLNDSVTPKDMSSVSVFVLNTGSQGGRLPAVMLGPGCHFLLTGPDYTGAVRGDAAMPAPLRDDSSISINPGNLGGAGENSRYVGMSGTHYAEGTPLAPFGAQNSNRSYALVGADTNDNARDFRMISPSRPQNSTDCNR